jgi:hypothetical protein
MTGQRWPRPDGAVKCGRAPALSPGPCRARPAASVAAVEAPRDGERHGGADHERAVAEAGVRGVADPPVDGREEHLAGAEIRLLDHRAVGAGSTAESPGRGRLQHGATGLDGPQPAAPSSSVGICDVVNDDALVGTSSTSAPAAMASRDLAGRRPRRR